MVTEKDRSSFEAWAVSQGYAVDSYGESGDYWPSVQRKWEC